MTADPSTPAAGREPMDLAVPLTEIEKAELLEACRRVLKPAGVLLLRRVLFQLDRHPAAASAEGREQARYFVLRGGFSDDSLLIRTNGERRGTLVLKDGTEHESDHYCLSKCLEHVASGSWVELFISASPALQEAGAAPASADWKAMLKALVWSYDSDESLEFIAALRKARRALGLKLADTEEDRDEAEVMNANGYTEDGSPLVSPQGEE